MGRKDHIIIVNETALRRREAKQRKKKKIIGMVAGVTAVVAIAAGVILVKNIVSSSKNDSKQEVESQQSAQDAEGTTGTEQAGTETEVKEEAAVEYDKLESKEKVEVVNGVAVVGIQHTNFLRIVNHRQKPMQKRSMPWRRIWMARQRSMTW